MNEARQSEAPHPSLKAMLVCDRAMRDPQTKKLSLLGILDRIEIPNTPADYVSGMTIYVRLTDAQGWYDSTTIMPSDAVKWRPLSNTVSA